MTLFPSTALTTRTLLRTPPAGSTRWATRTREQAPIWMAAWRSSGMSTASRRRLSSMPGQDRVQAHRCDHAGGVDEHAGPADSYAAGKGIAMSLPNPCDSAPADRWQPQRTVVAVLGMLVFA